MSLFKCKMCGGDLEIAEGQTIAECEYCGTKQTVPKVMDENLQNIFNRANTLRIKSEFDKAEELYEKIIEMDTAQSEAYWGLILCKYGIEYVDDPTTFKKIPTCHRASYDSIIADEDYKSAIMNADASQRLIYEEQAKEIDRIQKDILSLAQKEEAYDVFICYKETDNNGKRTQDSVIANDIYYQLQQEGFKVFYAAITLEGKLGSVYEPIIFAALNSAKVMLSIGTKQEYFNAVWVKNEWSRFLKIIKKDRNKILIPCYRDMDAYELPEEFAHLQAQDMSKIGFINDIVRGIKKIVNKDDLNKNNKVNETVISNANVNNVDVLLKRAFMFLEDGDYTKADIFCEKVLNQEPENAQAYLGKLMAEMKVRKREYLKNRAKPFNVSNNYQKILRFGEEKLKQELIEYINYINIRNENERIEGIYNTALTMMNKADTLIEYEKGIKLLKSIIDYKDSKKIISEKENTIQKVKSLISEYLNFGEKDSIEKDLEKQHEILCSLLKEQQELNDLKSEWQNIYEKVNLAQEKRNEINKKIDQLGQYKDKLGLLAIKEKSKIKDEMKSLENERAVFAKEHDLTIKCMRGFKSIFEIDYKINSIDQKIKETNFIIESLSQKINLYSELGTYEWGEKFLKKYEEKLNITPFKIITLGNHYGKIEWVVLKVKNGQALLLSKYGIDVKPYENKVKILSDWWTCDLRKWIRNDFFPHSFSDDEKKNIIPIYRPVTLRLGDMDPHDDFYKEYIFLLDKEQLELAQKDAYPLICSTGKDAFLSSGLGFMYFELTDYAKSKIKFNSERRCWWLYNEVYDTHSYAHIDFVSTSGNILQTSMDDEYVAFRPALWLDINSYKKMIVSDFCSIEDDFEDSQIIKINKL